MTSRSVRLVRWWVRLYTRGIPEQVGTRRRTELESDLFEHVTALGSGGVVGRWIRGIPADVWWRIRTTRHGARRSEGSLSMSINQRRRPWVIAVFAHAVIQLLNGATTVFGSEAGSVATGIALAGTAGLAVMLFGLAAQRRRPVGGSWLVVAGLIPSAVSVTGVVVLVVGLWTANLVFSGPGMSLGYEELQSRRLVSLGRWWVWILIALVPFGSGWVGLYIDNWYVWFGSWVLSAALALIGLGFAVAARSDRHRTREA